MGLEFNGNSPIYIQVMNDMKRKIVKGDYAPRSKVESVRDLAISYGANPNTIQRALQELEREGLVYSERTTGRFTTENVDLINECRKALASEFSNDFVNNVKSIGMSLNEGIDLLEEMVNEKGNE